MALLVGGSGITPFYQLLVHAAKHAKDNPWTPSPHITLLYSNHTEKDILLFKELQALRRSLPNFTLIHTLTRERGTNTDDFKPLFGRISPEMIRSSLPASKHTTAVVCGPRTFSAVAITLLQEDGYPNSTLTELES